MSSPVTLRPITKSDLPAYRELYESAFPPEERKELSFMLEGEMASAYDVLVIETPEAPVAGLIISVRHGDYVMLDYLAIQPALRGRASAMPPSRRSSRGAALMRPGSISSLRSRPPRRIVKIPSSGHDGWLSTAPAALPRPPSMPLCTAPTWSCWHRPRMRPTSRGRATLT